MSIFDNFYLLRNYAYMNGNIEIDLINVEDKILHGYFFTYNIWRYKHMHE